MTRLEKILAGQDQDQVSARTVRSPRRHQRKLTQDEIEALILARTEGAEIDQLAEHFGIGRTTVIAHLDRQGIPGRRWPGRTLSPDQLEQAEQLYESGLSLMTVARQFGVDRRYLNKALRAAGFTIRKAGQQKR